MSDEKTELEGDEDKSGMPVKQEVFLEAGVHIGTKIRTNDMRPFVFKRRDDGLYILDLRKSANRLIYAAKMMSKFKPRDVLVVASRVYSSNPASRFSNLTGIPVIQGRFIPGTFTNITCGSFREPKLVLVCDPKGEKEAIKESAKNGIPVIALCDTDNETKFIDLIIPMNNKGKRSLALAFHILTRELMMVQGKISDYAEFTKDVHYFEQPLPEKKEVEKVEESEKETGITAEEEKAVQEKEEEKKADEALKAAKKEKSKEDEKALQSKESKEKIETEKKEPLKESASEGKKEVEKTPESEQTSCASPEVPKKEESVDSKENK